MTIVAFVSIGTAIGRSRPAAREARAREVRWSEKSRHVGHDLLRLPRTRAPEVGVARRLRRETRGARYARLEKGCVRIGREKGRVRRTSCRT